MPQPTQNPFQFFFDDSDEMLLILDTNLSVLEANSTFLSLVELQKDEVLGIPISQLFKDKANTSVSKLIDDLKKGMDIKGFKTTLHTKSNKTVQVQLIIKYNHPFVYCKVKKVADLETLPHLLKVTLEQIQFKSFQVGEIYVINKLCVWANSWILSQFNLSLEQITGKPIEFIFGNQEIVKKLVDNKGTFTASDEFSDQIFIPGTPDQWYEVIAKKLEESQHETHSLWLIQDISALKHSQKELQKTEDLLHSINKNVPGVIYQMIVEDDGNYRISYVSENTEKLFGIDHSKPNLFDEFVKLLPADEIPAFFASISKSIEQFTSWFYEGKYKNTNGQTGYFRGSSEPRMLKNKMAFDGIIMDITASKKAEIQLEEIQTILNASVSQTPIPMVIVRSVDYKILWMNEAVVDVLGIKDKNDFLNKSMLEMKPTWRDFDENGVEFNFKDTPLSKAFRGEYTRNLSYYIERNDGQKHWVMASSSPIYNKNGEIIAAFLVFPDQTEKHLAELNHRKTELVLKAMLDSINEGVLIVDAQLHVTHKNRRFHEIFNMPPELYDCSDDNILINYAAEQLIDRDAFFNRVHQIYATNEKIFDYIYFKNGAIVERTSFQLEEGSPISVRVWHFRDITEQRKHEQQLKEANERFNLFRDSATDSMYIYDSDFRIVEINKVGLTYFGPDVKKEDLLGRHILDLIPHIEHNGLYQKYCQVKETGIPFFTDDYVDLNGERLWFSIKVFKVGNGYGVVVSNITDLKKQQQLILKHQQLLTDSHRIAKMGVWELDIPSGEMYWTSEVYNIFGIKNLNQKLTLDSFKNILHPNSLDKVNHQFEFHREKFVFNDFECQIVRGDGEIRSVMLAGDINIDQNKGPKRVFGVIQDVTEQRNAESQLKNINIELEKRVVERTTELQKANTDLEAFTYSVSHDLRSPLRHIDGFVRMLYKNIPQIDEKTEGYYQKIIHSTERMSTMINDLLSFSRLGRQELILSGVHTNPLVAEIIEPYTFESKYQNISWVVKQLHPVKADKGLLKLVFENLISNAVKYSSRKKQPVIEISSSQLHDYIEYSISDNGVGFNSEYKSKLFGVFQRLHTNEEFEGTGIGLANVKQIIKKHGGTVRAESELGKGATFYFTIPK